MTLAYAASAPPKASPARMRSIRIFAILGDNAAVARAEALAEQDGIDVRATHADETLAGNILHARDADIILVDADLSDAGAGQVVERELARAPSRCPLIVRTSSLRPDAARRLMRLEAVEVIETEIDASNVASTIFRVLGSRRPQQAAKVCVSMIYEDTEAASEATDRGEPISRLRPDGRLCREIREAVRVALPGPASTPEAKAPLGLLNIGKLR